MRATPHGLGQFYDAAERALAPYSDRWLLARAPSFGSRYGGPRRSLGGRNRPQNRTRPGSLACASRSALRCGSWARRSQQPARQNAPDLARLMQITDLDDMRNGRRLHRMPDHPDRKAVAHHERNQSCLTPAPPLSTGLQERGCPDLAGLEIGHCRRG